MTSEYLCVIPARGGSKRLPRKNVLDLAGDPMISYTIQAAREIELFEEVYVATDDNEIADIAREYGATVPYIMPDEQCDDKISSHRPAQHLAESVAENGIDYEALVLLQPTSPLRIPTDIKNGIEEYRNNDYDFVVSVTHIDPHYFHWAMEEGEDGYWQMHFGNKYMKERPLLPNKYRPNGSVKIADLDSIRNEGHFFGDKCGVFETPRRRSIHVATKYEFDIAESLLNRRKGKWE